jgi:MFS superfamily sulfate permease-like transporter
VQFKPNKATLSNDLVAGLIFALVNIPQSMAHALKAAQDWQAAESAGE